MHPSAVCAMLEASLHQGGLMYGTTVAAVNTAYRAVRVGARRPHRDKDIH
jgi:hypothetical protein